MGNETSDEVLVCGSRTVKAPDGADIPVPVGEIAGVRRANGVLVEISPTAPVKVTASGDGYYVVMNCAEPENGEAVGLAQDLGQEAIQELLEKALVETAPKAIKFGLSVSGLLADLLTASKLTREVFIDATYQEVPIRYCILC